MEVHSRPDQLYSMPQRPAKALLIDLLSDVLEMVAYGEDAGEVGDLLCRRAETFAPEVICSILYVDDERKLRPLAAPSLPEHYSAALDGLPVGPKVGSCGTAAFRGEPVEVDDIENDELWADFKALALPLGLRACWSSPIKTRDGRVVGTFAFYYRKPRGPTAHERQIVARCTHLCAVLIENNEFRRRAHDEAFIDAMSGLPNRASFDVRLEEMTAEQRQFALLFADLDHLKRVNDTLGHAAGDELIRIASTRLKSVSPDVEAFRLGGDEFAFILRACESEPQMVAIAQSLIQAVGQPVEYQGMTLQPSLTAGGVFQGETGSDKNTLYQNADFALYHAKDVNRGGFVSFRQGMRTTMTQRLRAIAEVDEALAEGRILPHYQPIVRLGTAEIVGLEALARIRTRDGGIMAAAEFHCALSDPRIAYALTSQMLVQVAADIRHWLALGLPLQHVGFNITTADLQKGDLERRVAAAFSDGEEALRHLILEVNEAVFVNDDMVADEIKSLRGKGILVALDDFGTGFASLTHLLDFPVDIMKIDKSFIDRIVDDPSSAVIVQALLDISRKLGMRIVAEGVETKEQAERLMEMGCTMGQGYYFARPASAAITAELLTRFAHRPSDKTRSIASRTAATGQRARRAR
jgi:diguanylate cyclase (GGDEF)-like protein